MNKLHLLYLIIQIFIFGGYSKPFESDITVFNVLETSIARNCPGLSNNMLFNTTTDFLLPCKGVSLTNLPKSIDKINLNNFFCVAILDADIRLCDVYPKNPYTNLTRTYEELGEIIDSIKKAKPDQICAKFAEFKPVESKADVPNLSKWMSKLNESLRGPQCVAMCSDLLPSQTNALCSLLYYINVEIENIPKKPVLPVADSAPNTPQHVEQHTQPQQPLIQQLTGTDKKNNSVESNPTTVIKNSADLGDTVAPNKKITVQSPKQIEEHKQSSLAVGAFVPKALPTKSKTESVIPVNNHASQESKLPKQTKTDAPSPTTIIATTSSEITTRGHGLVGVVAAKPEPKPDTNLDSKPDTNLDSKPDAKLDDKPEEKPIVSQEASPAPVVETTPPKSEEPQLPSLATSNLADPLKDGFDASVGTSLKINPDLSQDQEYEEPDDQNEEDTNPLPEKEQMDLVGIRPVNEGVRNFVEVEDSNFFSYFMFISVMFIAGYVVYHNKQKILALLLEGRRDRNSRRRPNTASYRKLNSNLEEAVTSKCSGSAAHVIY